MCFASQDWEKDSLLALRSFTPMPTTLAGNHLLSPLLSEILSLIFPFQISIPNRLICIWDWRLIVYESYFFLVVYKCKNNLKILWFIVFSYCELESIFYCTCRIKRDIMIRREWGVIWMGHWKTGNYLNKGGLYMCGLIRWNEENKWYNYLIREKSER